MSKTNNKRKKEIKMKKAKDALYDFLKEHQIRSKGIKCNYVSWSYEMKGKFLMPKEQIKKFLKLYCKAIKVGITDLSIAEKPKDYGPIKIDVDLEICKDDHDENFRLYDEKIILEIIDYYRQSIKKYLDVSDSELQCFVFEKPNYSDKGDIIHDGIHMIFPGIITHFKIRHLIRDEVLILAELSNSFDQYSNPIKRILDKAIVSSNYWFLYGSSKPGSDSYQLKSIITHDDSEIDTNEFVKEHNIVKLFSLQDKRWKKSEASKFQDEYDEDKIESLYNKDNYSAKSNFTDDMLPEEKEEEIRKAVKIVDMLSYARSDSYEDWIRVGWALRNTDVGLLPVWIKFSKLSKKFVPGECERKWYNMRDPSSSKSRLTIASLCMWAQEDNPEEYDLFKKDDYLRILKKNTEINSYGVAKALHAKYYDSYICANIGSGEKDIWYEFKDHRWKKIPKAHTLIVKMSEEFADEYLRLVKETIDKTIGLPKNDIRELLDKERQKYQTISEKLRHTGFKKQVLEEAKYLFYNPNFMDYLDESTNLIGFENGVLDLETMKFRDGSPDDYISLSTKVDYVPWNEKHPIAKKIRQFLKEILPIDSVREYFLTVLSTCLSGENKEEKFYIESGTGSNGKSLVFAIVREALGEYYISCPVQMLTKKRNASNQASPELAMLKGKRCGIYQEPDNGEKLNVGLLKELTGNDVMMVRGLYSEPIQLKFQLKFFLQCNDLPNVPSQDGGTWRRIRLIAFISKFIEQPNPNKKHQYKIDYNLKNEIKKWGEMFASLLVMYYGKYVENKFSIYEPSEVTKATDAYKAKNDFMEEYFRDKLVNTDNDKDCIKKMELWTDFKQWYKIAHEKIPNKNEFEAFIEVKVGKITRKGWTCIRWKDDDDNSNDNNIEI